MFKKLLPSIGKYKIYAILTPVMMMGEVAMEIFIPSIMALIIDKGIKGGEGVGYIAKMGLLMAVMSVVSLIFGSLGAYFGSKASMGFAKNLRGRLFAKIQDFSFANVDKFSTASLVTRLTNDVTNTQMAFMMLIRMAFRSPVMLVGAVIMAVRVKPDLSTIFLVSVPILALALVLIMTKAHPRFRSMLDKYDRMNADVQENLIGIRAVKAFVREDYEKEEFRKSAEGVRKAQVFAEKLIILNGPIMQLTMYGTILAILWLGGNMVINGSFEIGELSAFIT